MLLNFVTYIMFLYPRDAWKRLGSMPKEVAMTQYVDELKKVETFIQKCLYLIIISTI